MKRLGAAAELRDELRHPHALRHTCATELLRAGATVADMRVFLSPRFGQDDVGHLTGFLGDADGWQRRISAGRDAERGRMLREVERAEADAGECARVSERMRAIYDALVAAGDDDKADASSTP